MSTVLELGPHRCLLVSSDDPPVRDVKDATNLVGDALGESATVVAVAVEALDPSFFDLRSGFAGEFLQKAANYHLRFAVVGDVAVHTLASNAFRDLVVESERSQTFFFVADMETLAERLAGVPA